MLHTMIILPLCTAEEKSLGKIMEQCGYICSSGAKKVLLFCFGEAN